MKFINKIKTNKQARKSLLAVCGWGIFMGGFISVCSWITGLIGGKLGERISDLMWD